MGVVALAGSAAEAPWGLSLATQVPEWSCRDPASRSSEAACLLEDGSLKLTGKSRRQSKAWIRRERPCGDTKPSCPRGVAVSCLLPFAFTCLFFHSPRE